MTELLVLESYPGGEGRVLARSASRFVRSVQLLPDRDLPLAVRASQARAEAVTRSYYELEIFAPSGRYQLTKSDHELFEQVSSGLITAMVTEQRTGVP